MAEHRTVEEAFGLRPAALAEKIGNLRYDELERLLRALADKTESDARADKGRGRSKLSSELSLLSYLLQATAASSAKLWAICSPHMPQA